MTEPEIQFIAIDDDFLSNMIPSAVEMFKVYIEKMGQALDDPEGYTDNEIISTYMEDALSADSDGMLNPVQRLIGDALLQGVFLLEAAKAARK